MSRIWVKLVNKNKILLEKAAACNHDEVEETLREVCREFDVPSPMWLKKQYTEFDKFGMTNFTRENFFENIKFDRLEVNYLADDGFARRSSDPRNDFSDSGF